MFNAHGMAARPSAAPVGLTDGNSLNGRLLAFEPGVRGLPMQRCEIDGRLADYPRARGR
jgi:hypothetical protein